MMPESSPRWVLVSAPCEESTLCCTASNVLSTVSCYAAAKKEEEELKAQKSSSQVSSPQQQQGLGEAHPPSSSDQPKAASTSSSVAGSISLASWSHQGIAEKAKEVISSYMSYFRFVRLESSIQAASVVSFCILLCTLLCIVNQHLSPAFRDTKENLYDHLSEQLIKQLPELSWAQVQA